MRRLGAAFALLCALVGCSREPGGPERPPIEPDLLIGAWRLTSAEDVPSGLAFRPDGSLALLGSERQDGVAWELHGDTLLLRMGRLAERETTWVSVPVQELTDTSLVLGGVSPTLTARYRRTLLGTLDGRLTWRGNAPLSGDDWVEVALEEVSPGKPPALLGRQVLGGAMRSPVRFSVPYDATRIEPARAYIASARLVAGGILYRTPQPVSAITAGSTDSLALVLERAR